MITEFCVTILLYAGVVLGGALLYFMGNLIFGFQRSGGKRLIIFVVGAVATLGFPNTERCPDQMRPSRVKK